MLDSAQASMPLPAMSIRNLTTLGSNLVSVTDIKRIQTTHSLCCGFLGDTTFTARRQSSRLSPSLSPASHLAIFPMTIPEGNQRFREHNQRPSSWGSSPALLGRVGQASTNTRLFLVCCSRCWQRQARLRKICYLSCNTDSVQE